MTAEPTTQATAGAPAEGAPAAPEGAPPQEPPAPAAEPEPTGAGKASSPTVDVASLHAGFTQRSQTVAAAKTRLGLEKSATDQELLAALDAKLAPPAQQSDDPAVQRQLDDLRDRQWRFVEQTYGVEIADQVRSIRSLALTTDDPADLAAAIYESRTATAPPAPSEPPAQEAAPPEGQAPEGEQGPPPEEGLAVGEPAGANPLGVKVAPQAITEGLKGTGNMREAARRLFGGRPR